MSKSFFEVFPTLKLDAKTKEIMEQTVVDKVSTTRKQDFIRVYISSKNLIDKRQQDMTLVRIQLFFM